MLTPTEKKHLCNSVVSCKNELCILWIVFKQCWFYRLRWSRCSNYCFTWKNGGSNTGERLTSLDVSLMQCSLSFFKHWQKHRRFFLTTSFQNKPSVNYAKDWLGQLLLICGLVWSGMEQGVTHGCDHNMGQRTTTFLCIGQRWWPIMKRRKQMSAVLKESSDWEMVTKKIQIENWKIENKDTPRNRVMAVGSA